MDSDPASLIFLASGTHTLQSWALYWELQPSPVTKMKTCDPRCIDTVPTLVIVTRSSKQITTLGFIVGTSTSISEFQIEKNSFQDCILHSAPAWWQEDEEQGRGEDNMPGWDETTPLRRNGWGGTNVDHKGTSPCIANAYEKRFCHLRLKM